MEKFEVTILGCGSALPTARHNPTSQVLCARERLYMIDCGEGTQLQMRRSRLHFNRLEHIFISHLHGDHCFGLLGLISTLSLLGRTAPLFIHAPYALDEPLQLGLKVFCQRLGYRVTFCGLDPTRSEVVHDDRALTVRTIPLSHRVPCCGYRFDEKPTLPHLRRDVLDYYGISLAQVGNIKAGADGICPDGTLVPNARLVRPAAAPRSYAYCSDTVFLPQNAPLLAHCDLLFHEATFGSDNAARAAETFHSTAEQAALMAKTCEAKRLLIGHYSSRYESPEPLLAEARAIFPNTLAASEGMTLRVRD